MTAPGRIEFRDVPVPTPAAGEVLLRIMRIGVCGSDVHVNHGKHPYTKHPVVQGHEYCGVVEGLGQGVAQVALSEGARVLIADLSDFRLGIADQCGIAERYNPRRQDLSAAVSLYSNTIQTLPACPPAASSYASEARDTGRRSVQMMSG